jgi:hypothetical protein
MPRQDFHPMEKARSCDIERGASRQENLGWGGI